MTQASIKVGMIAEETGALSFMGRASANVARMVVDEINANGGLLGRKIELYLEDGATTDAVAEAKAAKLVAQDKVDVIFGGIYSSTRQAIKGPAAVKGRTLYIYPEQYATAVAHLRIDFRELHTGLSLKSGSWPPPTGRQPKPCNPSGGSGLSRAERRLAMTA